MRLTALRQAQGERDGQPVSPRAPPRQHRWRNDIGSRKAARVIRKVRNPFVVSEGRIGRLLVTFMALGFLALVAAGIGAGWATGQNESHTRSVNHTYEVELAVSNARRLIEQGEASRRGYLLTGNPEYRDAYHRWS